MSYGRYKKGKMETMNIQIRERKIQLQLQKEFRKGRKLEIRDNKITEYKNKRREGSLETFTYRCSVDIITAVN